MSKEKKFNWSNEIVDELIDMIQEREVVWNVQSKQYHNKDNRKDAVIEICDKIGCTGEFNILLLYPPPFLVRIKKYDQTYKICNTVHCVNTKL